MKKHNFPLWVWTCVVLAACGLPAKAATGLASAGAAANGRSIGSRFGMSGDGTKVAFQSEASNLVNGDTNTVTDVFVRDLLTGITTRVSVDDNGIQGNGESLAPCMNGDGTKVAFHSAANNLVSGDTNNASDIFIRDLVTNTITRVSVAAGGIQSTTSSAFPSLSADGKKVAFVAGDGNLVAGDTNRRADIFVKDVASGAVRLASTANNGAQANGDAEDPSLNGDGTVVAFHSYASNLVSNDANGHADAFARNLTTGVLVQVSVHSSGAQAQGESGWASLSNDGTKVAFLSTAGNLVDDDTNGVPDAFVRNLATNTTTRVSVASGGAQADMDSWYPAISGDGTKVAFESYAKNLGGGATNACPDIFVHDLTTGKTVCVSVGSAGEQANNASGYPSLSRDGSKVAFHSFADNLVLGDNNGLPDIYVHG